MLVNSLIFFQRENFEGSERDDNQMVQGQSCTVNEEGHPMKTRATFFRVMMSVAERCRDQKPLFSYWIMQDAIRL